MIAEGRDREGKGPSTTRPDWELVLRFALFVARPGSRAMLIDRENHCGGFLPIIHAVHCESAFAVEVADDILAIDQDHPKLARPLDRLRRRLLAAGQRPVVCASGGSGGRRHLFVRVADRERWIACARQLGLPGDAIRTGRIRPPLSLHRDRCRRSELLDPVDPFVALFALFGRAPHP